MEIEPVLPAPKGKKQPDLLIVAAEHSGDEHAADLLYKIRADNPNYSVCALGGKAMANAGAQLLWNTAENAALGFVDVLKRYGYFKALFDGILHWIEVYKPRKICFVDSPGLNLRLAEALYKKGLSKKAGGPIPLFYYIGPQIWAWKAKRRFAIDKLIDSLGVIFPFEVDCYKDTGLPVHFVGHPFLQAGYRFPVHFGADYDVVLLPGSRKAPVKRILPILLEAFALYWKENPNIRGCILAPEPGILNLNKALAERFTPQCLGQLNFHIISRSQALGTRAFLASSGTISLMTALAGIPGAILYKANPITYWIGRRVVDIDRLGMPNILLNRFLCPEYIQGAAQPKVLAQELKACLEDPNRLEQAKTGAKELKKLLRAKVDLPAEDWLMRG